MPIYRRYGYRLDASGFRGKSMKKVLSIALFLALCFIAYPYFTFWRLTAAIANKDIVALDALIDWDSVRASLHSDLLARTALSGSQANQTTSGSEIFGIALTSAIAGKVIDAIATSSFVVRKASEAGVRTPDIRDWVGAASFRSPARFEVQVGQLLPSRSDDGPIIVMALRGSEWRVTRIVIPDEKPGERKSMVTPQSVDQELPKHGEPQPAKDVNAETAVNSPPAAPAKKSPEWEFTEDRSPLDDSAQLTAALLRMPDSDRHSGAMVVRCKERKTEVLFAQDRYLGTHRSLQIIYRINDNQAQEVTWFPSTTGKAVFVQSPVQFLKKLPQNGKLFIRIHDFSGIARDDTFYLGDVEVVKVRIAAICKWPTTLPAQTQSQKPIKLAP